MHLNIFTDYSRSVACALSYRMVTRWVKASHESRIASVDLHHTGWSSIPQHQIDIINGLSMDCPGIICRSCLSHHTVWQLLKKWRILVRSVAIINKPHLVNGFLQLIFGKRYKICW
ncbi:hypothetical protein AVEN_178449-1 [Araneus ventricosus]|uniref:Uncharacterized protein n=1 Tax=Araneus ventricosus TaxID=182803 RepID=A0A4Y2IAR0_ARAVE|nr:hypothetical protein AVEN_178449-1 [Araneus ventricosus]